MNLFKRELKANSKAMIIWTLSSMLLCYVSYWEYGAADAADQMADLFAGFPPVVNTLFGVSPLGVSDIVGYSALIIYYIYFIGLIYAMMLGSKLVQKELDDQTSEFLFTKPIERTKVLFVKTLVAKLNLFIFIVFNAIITISLMINIGDKVYSDAEIIKYMILSFFGLYLFMIVTFMVTIAVNMLVRNKRASMIAGGMFIMYSYASSVAVLSLEKLNDFTIISPWRYFSPDIIVNDGFSIIYFSIFAIVSVALYIVARNAIKTKTF